MTASGRVKLKPGDTIGILGGGQLGRMLAMAAARLGLRCQVFSPDPDSPAFDVVQHATCAEYADVEALELFANDVDVITYEFENVPAATAMVLAARRPVLPAQKILETTQDRLREKNFLRDIGVATTEFREIADLDALTTAIGELGAPAVLKTVRMGYDGKGQVLVAPDSEPQEAWRRMGGSLGILEGFVDFRCEISVVLARVADGGMAVYPPVENRHVNHILDTTIAPADLPAETLAKPKPSRATSPSGSI